VSFIQFISVAGKYKSVVGKYKIHNPTINLNKGLQSVEGQHREYSLRE